MHTPATIDHDTWTRHGDFDDSPIDADDADGAPPAYRYAGGAYLDSLEEAVAEWTVYGELPTQRLDRPITAEEIAAIVGGAS